MTRLSVVVLALSMFLFADSFAATWFIKPDGTGDAPTIQAGIDSTVDRDTVLLADGIYTGDGNRDLTIQGKTIVVRSQSGNPELCVIDCEGSVSDPHRGFYLPSSPDSLLVLTAVTIRNGNHYKGGAIHYGGAYWDGFSITSVINCIFENNSSDRGSAIYMGNWTPFDIIDCRFLANAGTAVYIDGYGWAHAQYAIPPDIRFRRPEISGCLFTNGEKGLAIRGAGATLTNCTFSSNNIGIATSSSDLTLDGCQFNGNLKGALIMGESGAEITNCTFVNNSATRGAAIRAEQFYGPLEVSECEFVDNSASDTGGAVYCGSYMGRVKFTDCQFSNNSAQKGGAANIRQIVEDFTFERCIFNKNRASDEGGAIRLRGHVWGTIDSCTFYGNSSQKGSSLHSVALNLNIPDTAVSNSIFAFGNASEAISCDSLLAFTVECSNLFGNDGGDWVGCISDYAAVNGNFSERPGFCGPESGNFTLAAASRCLPTNNESGALIGACGQGCDYADGVPSFQAAIMSYPNPFWLSTTIEYFVPSSGAVSLQLFDVGGRLVTTLIQGEKLAGVYTTAWGGRDMSDELVPSGVYFARLKSGGQIQTRKIVRIK